MARTLAMLSTGTASLAFSFTIAAAAALHAETPASKAPKAVPSPGKAGPQAESKAKAPDKAVIDPALDSAFFKTMSTSRPQMITEHDDGSLEDIGDDRIDPEDLLLVEHTADCVSNSQGEHKVSFADAVATAEGVEISIHAGLDYSGSLKLTLHPDLGFESSYSAVYKAPTGPLEWKITKQSLRLKSDKQAPGTRLYAWVSVEFEETYGETGQKFSGKIEGYIKPVIRSGK